MGPDLQQFSKAKAVDVLIVGAGPTGLFAAACFARYGVSFRLIDKTPIPIQRGHAMGIQPRTLEIMHTLGLQHVLAERSDIFSETSFWFGTDAGLQRSKDSPEPEIIHPTEYPYAITMHQGHMESLLINDISSRGHSVDRPMTFVHYAKKPEHEFPSHAYIKNEISGMVEEVPTKYILGCDGAKSIVRQSLNIESSIHHTEETWAVADVHASTDFPDCRRRCSIRSSHGNIMLIPIGNNGNRIYTLLTEKEVSDLNESRYEGKGQDVKNDFTAMGILTKRTTAILRPFKIEINSVDWVSIFHVSQRIASSFSDTSERVFILGDACHTHSPKAGQGMNVSMSDAYNLTWKVALSLRNLAAPSLLRTYQTERQHIAKQLVDFDEKFSKLFGSAKDQEDPALHQLYFQNKGFTSGIALQYPSSPLVDTHIDVAIDPKARDPVTPGKRLLSNKLTRHIDGTIVSLLDEMSSLGRFHIFVFAGNLLPTEKLTHLSAYLASPSSPLSRFSSTSNTLHNPSTNPQTLITLYLIHTSPHMSTPLETLPAPFSQWWYSVFEDVGGKMHGEIGVDVEKGAVLVVRPDGYVGLVTGMEGGVEERVGKYFGGILVEG